MSVRALRLSDRVSRHIHRLQLTAQLSQKTCSRAKLDLPNCKTFVDFENSGESPFCEGPGEFSPSVIEVSPRYRGQSSIS